MRNPILFTLLLSSALILAFTHFAALTFDLHYGYPWLDIPMHALGGTIISFSIFALASFFSSLRHYVQFLPVLLVVLCVGLLWELFEISIGFSTYEVGFITDMMTDIFAGVAGGAGGYFIAQRLDTL